MGVPSLNNLAVGGTLNTTNQPTVLFPYSTFVDRTSYICRCFPHPVLHIHVCDRDASVLSGASSRSVLKSQCHFRVESKPSL